MSESWLRNQLDVQPVLQREPVLPPVPYRGSQSSLFSRGKRVPGLAVSAPRDLMEGELYSALKEEEASESVSSTNFSGEMHFYELVEDTKDGIWLVQVIANDRSPLMGKVHWEKMVKKVSRFGIRTGTFNCSNDPRYCRRRGWVRSTLIMSVPQTSTSKGKVMLKEYNGRKIETEHIFKWITAHAASRIKTIFKSEHLKEEWNKGYQYRVKIYLFAKLDQPPAFFSALSVKFTGRVEFIFVNVENWDNKSHITEMGIYKTPSYILRTPEGIYKYGNNTGEFISLHAMDSFLRSLQPEVNDLFVLSLVLVNLMAWMDLFITQGATIKRFVVLISTLGTYNSLLIISWLPVLGFLQLPYLDSFYEYSLKLFRYSNTTTLASWVRADWMFYSSHPALFLSTYLGHGLLIDYFEKKRRHNNSDEINANNLEWLSSLWDWYTSYLFHPITSFQHFPFESDWDEDPDLFLDRLAFPDLWLHPLIPTDYIKNLPIWRFKCFDGHSEEEMMELSQSENDSDSESKEVPNNDKELFEDERRTHLNPCEGETFCSAETCSCAKAKSYGSYSTRDDLEPDWSAWPAGMLHCTECVVCLENFINECLLMGLPCGHVFHQNCIVMWLVGGRHCCPVCRWASYKKKKPYVHHQLLSNHTLS
ncbi:E3 ubiquitin-protein ligase RNF103 isoform X2 [Crotalus tigris]|uniref:E3 ubiquitin-protein ligase RNF103 isoform X2 n=1 Tax=Crotalus tigris TaxID=88082 RepID=UPI00192F8109|nr:E3 ubiquitin-protein ligase RNF103 isoform X2 [Crotalus tigris]